MPTDVARRRVLAGLGALALGVQPLFARAQEEVRLRFLDYRGSLAESALAKFASDTGIAVAVETCPGPAASYALLKAGDSPGYDLVVVPDRYVARMIFAGLLHPLDPSLVPNLRNIDAAFANADFDPGRRHSVGYLWGTLGMAWRRSAAQAPPDSWQWLLDSDRHAGRIGLLDDPQLTIGIALKYLGHSANAVAPADIEAAASLLRRQRPRVARVSSTATAEPLVAHAADVTLATSGDAASAARRDEDIAYVVPREGSLLWQDCLCIPRAAAHAREAHALIDFLLRADVGAGIANATLCATPNAAARAASPEAYRTDPVIYPAADVLERCEIAAYRGELLVQLYERAWNTIGLSAGADAECV